MNCDSKWSVFLITGPYDQLSVWNDYFVKAFMYVLERGHPA